MKDSLDTLHRESQTIKLSEAEREAMRKELLTYIQKKPLAPQPVRSPFYTWYYRHTYIAATMAVALVVLIAGSGITYAARNAQPGDLLYPVKKTIQKPIAVFLGAEVEPLPATSTSSVSTEPQQTDTASTTTVVTTPAPKKVMVPAATVNVTVQAGNTVRKSSPSPKPVQAGVTVTSTSSAVQIQATTSIPLLSATTSASVSIPQVPQASVEVNVTVPVQKIINTLGL